MKTTTKASQYVLRSVLTNLPPDPKTAAENTIMLPKGARVTAVGIATKGAAIFHVSDPASTDDGDLRNFAIAPTGVVVQGEYIGTIALPMSPAFHIFEI